MSLKLPRNWDFSTFRAETNKIARSKSVMPGEGGAGPCRPGSPKSSERPLKTGWLKKQRSIVKNWQLRYFVLRGYTLYYYKDDKDNAFQGHINLRPSQVNELPSSTDDPGKFLFEIIPGSSGDRERDPYVLMANSQNEMEEWVRTLRRVIGVPSSGAVFGKSLGDTVAYERRFGPHLVPILVQECAEFILEHGLSEEGIFRLPGQDNQVKQFRDAFDAGERPSFPSDTDVHTVASLFKLYLRELPEPVIPWSQYQDFLDCSHLLNPNGNLGREKLEKQISLLPRANYNLLSYICRFLYKVQQNSKVNKMSVENLATVIGVNLLKPQIEDPVTMMKGTSQIQKLMTVMIRQHESLFPPPRTCRLRPPPKKRPARSTACPAASWDGTLPRAKLCPSPRRRTVLGRWETPGLGAPAADADPPLPGGPRGGGARGAPQGQSPGDDGGPHPSCSGRRRKGGPPRGEGDPVRGHLQNPGPAEGLAVHGDKQGGPRGQERGSTERGAAIATKPDPPKPSSGPAQPQTRPQTRPPQEERAEGRAETARSVVSTPSLEAKTGPQKNTQDTPESLVTSLQRRNEELVARVTELQSALDAEKRLVTSLEIRLRNAERSRDQAEQRNQELDREIQSFLSRRTAVGPP
ncbi:hypothetical protein ANANG_G00189220 [Anguilla anguilla]|uniref:Rho GTPase activating protein 25 n=1 Tax=Anguilla anguilla TaxID=7936 RepID=A0A9D3RSK2_ANGAN|nr:hypothetical protein ANANG_G00189220 [Anguilla anguilla]